jgi:hypothetical protein
LHLLVVLLCLRKLARARARQRILSDFFSKDIDEDGDKPSSPTFRAATPHFSYFLCKMAAKFLAGIHAKWS